MPHKLIGNIQILLGASLFGLIPIIVRFGYNLDTLSLVFFRALFGACAILVILKIQKRILPSIRKDFFKILFWSLILLFAISSYFFALKRIDIASATLLLNLNSVFIILFSKMFLKEKIHSFTIVSLVLSLIGAALVIDYKSIFHIENFIGYIAALSAAFWTGLNFVFPKFYFRTYDTFSMTFYQSIFQTSFLLPFILLHPPSISINSIIVFLGLGVFCTAFAFTLIYSGSQKTKSQFIGIFQTSESIVPIILACLLFQEYPTPLKITGGVLLIIAFIIIIWRDRK